MTPLPHRRWRVYVRPSSETADLVEESRHAVRRYVPEFTFRGVENARRFYCHSRVASRYRAGRVLLAGDAAHACTPAEGHGMNTGLQDVFNLGWKLAHVCLGEADADLLDTYEVERRPVAERIVDSGAATEALLPDTPPVQPADGQPCPLHELAHNAGHTLLVLGGPRADPARVSALLADLDRHRGPLVSAVHGLCTQPADASLGQIDDAIDEVDDDGAAVESYLAGLVA
jgi:hypothetical protein